MSTKVGKLAHHVVGVLCGVKEEDSRIAAAEKALATMKAAGFSRHHIAKAERMIAEAKARGMK